MWPVGISGSRASWKKVNRGRYAGTDRSLIKNDSTVFSACMVKRADDLKCFHTFRNFKASANVPM